MEKKTELKDVQKEALKILLAFRDICEKNGLNYYISGGTFLGAVRHGGFIPWDDDVDVAMPRKDFNRFLEIVEKELPEGYSINHFTRDHSSMYYVPKIENSKIQLISRIAREEKKIPLWIDIFPLDGLPDNPLIRKIHCFRLLCLRGEYKLAFFDQLVNYKNKNRPWYENAVISVAKKVNIGKLFDSYKVFCKLDKVLSRYDFYESTDIMNFMGSYKFRSIMNREEIYKDGAVYLFEGYEFNAPKEYDIYLKQIYGDYMKLPPEEKRNWHETEVVSE